MHWTTGPFRRDPDRRERLRPPTDLRAFRPRSLGRVLKPLERGEDLLDEMLGSDS